MIYLLLFFLAKHNYEPGLNGQGRELVVRKDVVGKSAWDSGMSDEYSGSTLDTWLNGAYKNRFSAAVQTLMGNTSFYYTARGEGAVPVTALSKSVFALSVTELGGSGMGTNVEGSPIPIASTIKGLGYDMWTRSRDTMGTYFAWYIDYREIFNSEATNSSQSRLPCFSLPSGATVDDNLNLLEQV